MGPPKEKKIHRQRYGEGGRATEKQTTRRKYAGKGREIGVDETFVMLKYVMKK